MKTEPAKMINSLMILAGSFVLTVALGIHNGTEPPTPSWRDDFDRLYFLPLLSALWFAARYWYSLPVFFGYGAFLMVPLGWGLFGPQTRHGIEGPVPPYAAVKTFAFCVGSGLFAALVGALSRREQLVADRRRCLSADDQSS